MIFAMPETDCWPLPIICRACLIFSGVRSACRPRCFPRLRAVSIPARLRERARAGMRSARRAGKHVGRSPALKPEKLDLAHRLIEEGKGRAAVAGMLGVHPATLRRALKVGRL